MHWQDWIFSIGNFIFAAAVIPTIIGKDKPALATSIVNTSFLVLFIVAFASLQLWLSAFASSLTTTAWFILAYQKYKQNKK